MTEIDLFTSLIPVFLWASVLSHEMGHCLGLWHTFHSIPTESDPYACVELVDGSNCAEYGDYVCDTPADPFSETSFSSQYPQIYLFDFS